MNPTVRELIDKSNTSLDARLLELGLPESEAQSLRDSFRIDHAIIEYYQPTPNQKAFIGFGPDGRTFRTNDINEAFIATKVSAEWIARETNMRTDAEALRVWRAVKLPYTLPQEAR